MCPPVSADVFDAVVYPLNPELCLLYHGIYVDGNGAYDYVGEFTNETEYNAITWNDGRTKPDYTTEVINWNDSANNLANSRAAQRSSFMMENIMAQPSTDPGANLSGVTGTALLTNYGLLAAILGGALNATNARVNDLQTALNAAVTRANAVEAILAEKQLIA